MTRMYRVIRLRLLIPMFRSPGKPEIIARGVMVGLFWAMLPFFGIQMALVLFTWFCCRNMFAWDFSLSQALAWTWVTNFFTILPACYAYYITGQLLIGDFSDLTGYAKFVSWFEIERHPDAGWWESGWQWLGMFFSDWGWPILMGSLPWTFLFAASGYFVSLRLLQEYRRNRLAGQRL